MLDAPPDAAGKQMAAAAALFPNNPNTVHSEVNLHFLSDPGPTLYLIPGSDLWVRMLVNDSNDSNVTLFSVNQNTVCCEAKDSIVMSF